MKKPREIYAVVADPNYHSGDSRSIQCMTTNGRIAVLAARSIAKRDTSRKYTRLTVVCGVDGDPCGMQTRPRDGLFHLYRPVHDSSRGWTEKFEGTHARYEPFVPCKGKTRANKGKFRLVIEDGGMKYRFSQDISWERIFSIVCFVDQYTIYNDKNEIVDILAGIKRETAA